MRSNRRFIIVIGNDLLKIEQFKKNFFKAEGEYNFGSYEDFKPLQKWINITNAENIINACYNTNLNLFINVNYLHEIPSEIRIQSEISIFNSEINLKSNENNNLRFWKLNFEKYRPKDLLQKI